MKRLTFTLLFSAAVLISHAQTINFGIRAGFNLSTQTHGSYTFGDGYLTGFNLGGIMNLGYDHFAIQPGLIFSQKGESDNYKYNNFNLLGGGGYAHSDTYLDYIEIPVYFLYEATPINGASLHIGGGPYFATGISEKDVVNGSTYSTKFNYNNPDVGFGLLCGVTFHNRIQADASCEFGIINIDNSSYTTRNIVISLSGGYFFK